LIDRTTKFAYVELYAKARKMAAAAFLRNLIAAVPYRIHMVLTDNGIQSTNHERYLHALEHFFDRVCGERQIDHRHTKIKHPWRYEDQKTIGRLVLPSDGQVERVNRTIKDATVKACITTTTISFVPISLISSPPVTSGEGSSLSKASCPTSSYANNRQLNPNGSP